MEFVTLNIIITDLLNIIRSAKVNASEPISRKQLETWIHQYRALLLKRDLDKNKKPNPDYLQDIVVELEPVDYLGADTLINSDNTSYRTVLQIPNTLDLNFNSGIMYIGDLSKNEIQLMSHLRSNRQVDRKYTKNDPTAYLKDRYIWVNNPNGLKYILVSGVFENPVEVYELVNPLTQQKLASYNIKYPIPMNLLPTLKEMILSKELGIIVSTLSDNTNDSNSLLEQNIKK